MAPLRLPALSAQAPVGRRARGVTLIELMVVVVVVALLAAVALPSYQDSLRKARRADARAALTTCAQHMERYFTENSRYTDANLARLCPPDERAPYELQLAVSGPNAYVLTAVPRGAQGNDGCGKFTLDQNGLGGVAGGSLSAAQCW